MWIQLACVLEATARKPGNIHRFQDFEEAHYLDFLIAAMVLDRQLDAGRVRDLGLGRSILRATQESLRWTEQNANLGIILLLAPLVAADGPLETLRESVAELLDQTTVDDARAVYRAIRTAEPAGLGTVPEQDVAGVPTVTLTEAMRLAADCDGVARQYATDFADVFDLGLPSLRTSLEAGRPLETAIVSTHLILMASCPDSLIARKRGPAEASESARRAAETLSLGWPDTTAGVKSARRLDAWLREAGHERNPGTTADLIAACLYLGLRGGLIRIPEHTRREGWSGGTALNLDLKSTSHDAFESS